MASTNFQDYNQNTPIVATWLNDVNGVTYGANGGNRVALGIPTAWVRFSVVAGIVAIQQSVGVLSVVRGSTGVFTVNYAPLAGATNCYQVTPNIAGFSSYSAETSGSVTINIGNTANVPTDPGSCCVTISGGN